MSPPLHLTHQRGPLHDLPDTPEAYDAVLADVVEQTLARIKPDGSLEHPDCVDDIGDTSLGITSLPALAWQRGKDPRLPEAVHRSLAFHLRYGDGDGAAEFGWSSRRLRKVCGCARRRSQP